MNDWTRRDFLAAGALAVAQAEAPKKAGGPGERPPARSARSRRKASRRPSRPARRSCWASSASAAWGPA